jgi:geranylgeranyl diphosphate synthase type II
MPASERSEPVDALAFWQDALDGPRYELAHRYLSGIEPALHDRVSCYGSLAGPARHIVLAGGKRIRALVLLAVAEACGGDWKEAVDTALAIELIHTASLIHDDIIDGTPDRRGVGSVHARFGPAAAILTGDVFCFDAFMLAAPVPGAAAALAAACREMCLGEAMEAGPQAAEMKTAPLFGAAAEMGALVARADEQRRAQCRDYGRLLGTAFQLRDDQIDSEGAADPTPYAEQARACLDGLPPCAALDLLSVLADAAVCRAR